MRSPGLADVQDGGQADHGRAGIGVADHRHQQPGCDLFRGEAEHLADALRELGVGLVEDGVVVVGGCGAQSLPSSALPAVGDVLEVGRLAGEALAVLGVLLRTGGARNRACR